MGEIKSVKVDNWGVFFLQKLQNFFNKTDYCDLTLQFNDNSQLKVHRLVLSACTDYFNILEIQSDVVDNTLLMPKDFQADVVVPIVNFMYTGTLEFEYNMYDKLFRTAREMNMTVLVKLLEAHRKSAPVRPVVLNKSVGQQPKISPVHRISQTLPPQPTFPQRVNNVTERTYAANKKPVGRPMKHPILVQQPVAPQPPPQQKNIKYVSNFGKNRSLKDSIPETIAIVSNYRQTDTAKKSGPSRFDPTEEEVIPDTFDTFNTISYESTPLMKAEEKDDDYEEYEGEHSASSSTFEQLRKGYTNPNKRAASKVIAAPPAKKFNLQDVKDYTEAARLRKQLEADDDDENAFDYDADTHFDDEEETISTAKSAKSSQNNSLKEEKSFDSSIITTKDDQIIVKDNSGSVHHAKIISEVLKKYPHLVKNNKNIKLKILQKNNSSPTSVTIQEQKPAVEIIKQEKISPIRSQVKVEKEPMKLPVSNTQPTKSAVPVPPPTGPKKIDSKTMHALIAKGAENMTGPWLCLRCGVGKRPISIPSYKSFRRHLIQVHKEKIDPRICEHCGWKALKKNDLVDHYLNKHNIKIKVETVVKNQPSTSKDGTESSQKLVIQHCIYCNKTFSKEILLYAHMKSMHKEKAREDGVLDFSDDEQEFDESDKYIPNVPNVGNSSSQSEKIKILSNISLPTKGGMPFVIDSTTVQTISQLSKNTGQSTENLVKLEPSSEAEALSNVASGIATSLGLVDSSVVMDETHYHNDSTELIAEQYVHEESAALQNVIEQTANESDIITKLVTTDGEELSQFQKDEIISQIQRQSSITSDNVVMVLNQEGFEHNEILSSNDQNIVVVYSQTENDDGTTTLTTVTSKTTEVWQEECAITKQEEKSNAQKGVKAKQETTNKTEQKSESEKKNEEEKLKLISALEGDWSDDDEEDPITPAPSKPETSKKSAPIKDEEENLELIEKSLQETIKEVKSEEKPTSKDRTPEDIMSELLGVDKLHDESEISQKEQSEGGSIQSTKLVEDDTASPPKTTKESDVKELTNILGEWSSESFDETKNDESIEVEETIDDTSTQTNGADDSNSKLKDDDEDEELVTEIVQEVEDENSSTKPLDTSNSSSTPVEPKEDIKTLINDWEDDDGDL